MTGGNPWKVRSEVGDRLELECGCVMDIVGDAFVVVPCSPTCPAYLYVVAENKRQRHPVEVVFAERHPATRADVVAELNRAERRRRGHRGPR